MRAPLLLALAALLLSFSAHADETDRPSPFRGEGRLSVAPSYDTNATRRLTGEDVRADEAVVAIVSGELLYRPAEGHATTASFEGGGKLFHSVRAQDQLVGQLELRHAMRAAEFLVLGAEARLKEKELRGEERDYRDLSAAFVIELPFAIAPKLRLGARQFTYKPDERWDSRSPFVGVGVQTRPTRRHLLSAGYDFSHRSYPSGRAYDAHGRDHGALADRVHVASVGWGYRGPFVAGASYLFTRTDSNGYGLSSNRHRLQALVGVKLPLQAMLFAQGAYQLVHFPEGIRFSEELLLVEEDENLSSLAVKLTRPLFAELSVEARYQLYTSTFGQQALAFTRHVVGAGLAYRF